jgi:hypothetical protein
MTADGTPVFGFNRTLEPTDGESNVVTAGQRVRIAGTLENRLLPGRYLVSAMVSRNRSEGDIALHMMRLLDFVVYGTQSGPGSVSLEADVRASLEPGP